MELAIFAGLVDSEDVERNSVSKGRDAEEEWERTDIA